MQTAGDRVAAAAELAARVQHGQHDLDGRLALGGDDAHRDAAAVVDDADAAVGEDRDVDGVRVTGQRLVDGVVDDLVHQVVQAALTGRADVHAGSLADRVQTLQDGDRAGVVRRRLPRRSRRRRRWTGCSRWGCRNRPRSALSGTAQAVSAAVRERLRRSNDVSASAPVRPAAAVYCASSLPVAPTMMGVCRYLSPHVPP